MNNVISQLHRGLWLRFFLTSIATMGLCILSFLQPVLRILQEDSFIFQGYHNDLIFSALSSDILFSFLPVLSALPLSAGYLEDIKSKFVRFCLIRESYSSYLICQCFACWLCGSAVFIGAAITWGISTLIFTPMEQYIENYASISPKIVARLILLFFNSGLWAVTGIALSTVMESKYIAYMSPFIVYYLLIILAERYLPNAFFIYPKNWLSPESWPFGTLGAIIFLLELTFLAALLFYTRGRRRLEML